MSPFIIALGWGFQRVHAFPSARVRCGSLKSATTRQPEHRRDAVPPSRFRHKLTDADVACTDHPQIIDAHQAPSPRPRPRPLSAQGLGRVVLCRRRATQEEAVQGVAHDALPAHLGRLHRLARLHLLDLFPLFVLDFYPKHKGKEVK